MKAKLEKEMNLKDVSSDSDNDSDSSDHNDNNNRIGDFQVEKPPNEAVKIILNRVKKRSNSQISSESSSSSEVY